MCSSKGGDIQITQYIYLRLIDVVSLEGRRLSTSSNAALYKCIDGCTTDGLNVAKLNYLQNNNVPGELARYYSISQR